MVSNVVALFAGAEDVVARLESSLPWVACFFLVLAATAVYDGMKLALSQWSNKRSQQHAGVNVVTILNTDVTADIVCDEDVSDPRGTAPVGGEQLNGAQVVRRRRSVGNSLPTTPEGRNTESANGGATFTLAHPIARVTRSRNIGNVPTPDQLTAPSTHANPATNAYQSGLPIHSVVRGRRNSNENAQSGVGNNPIASQAVKQTIAQANDAVESIFVQKRKQNPPLPACKRQRVASPGTASQKSPSTERANAMRPAAAVAKKAEVQKASLTKEVKKSRGEIWNEHYAVLKKFHRKHKHVLIKSKATELGRWVGLQRMQHNQNSLPKHRKELLDKLGFVWNVRDALWEEGFRDLIRYKEEYGDCLVPYRFCFAESNKNLGMWVSMQRRRRTRLSEVQRQRLNAVGFVWIIRG